MSSFEIGDLAIPGVLLLISFLAYSSQYLFLRIEPGPLTFEESTIFNALVLCMLFCYARTCLVDPGYVPFGWKATTAKHVAKEKEASTAQKRQRFCSKCNQPKAMRSHHCKVCKRCVEKMDHHCPWTRNCVAHRSMPHFMHFLFYADVSMSYLQYLLWVRGKIIWDNRHFPSYLGPSVPALIHFFLLIAANSLTLFALVVLFLRGVWSLSINTTTIEGMWQRYRTKSKLTCEGWEIERHRALVRRARVLGGFLNGPNGEQIEIVKQEFPYDIGIWQNLKQSMGTGNILAWFWPFSSTPSLASGLEFPENGFEDPSVSWPPVDPDRIPRVNGNFSAKNAFTYQDYSQNTQDDIDAFHRRQALDRERYTNPVYRRQQFFQRPEIRELGNLKDEVDDYDDPTEGEEAWRNSEGERLGDFGVEEDVEFYDEDIPLATLIARRKQQQTKAHYS